MVQDEKQDISSSMPILQRLDRLDQLLESLEHKHCLSASVSCSSSSTSESIEPGYQHRKSLSSAIKEAHQKGALMERVTELENRVLQLSNEMDLANASKSSCSTILVSENKQDPSETQECCSSGVCVRKPSGCKKGKLKTSIVSTVEMRSQWFRWRRMGC